MKRKEKITALALIVVGGLGLLGFGTYHLARYLHDPYAHIEHAYIEQGETVELDTDVLEDEEGHLDWDGTFYPRTGILTWNGTMKVTIPKSAELFSSLEDAGIDPAEAHDIINDGDRILVLPITLENVDAVPKGGPREGGEGFNMTVFRIDWANPCHVTDSMMPNSIFSSLYVQLAPGETKTFDYAFILQEDDPLPAFVHAGDSRIAKYRLNFDIIDHTKGSDS